MELGSRPLAFLLIFRDRARAISRVLPFSLMAAIGDGERRTGYLDESRRKDVYAVAVVLVTDRTRHALRGAVADLLLPGEGRFHMAKERPARRRAAINSMRSAVDEALVVITSIRGAGSEEGARRACLKDLVLRLTARRVERLFIESRDVVRDGGDRRVIRSVIEHSGASLAYEHRRAAEEPLLWVADILAWTAGNGAEQWRLGPDVEVKKLRS
jgi:hypothetical protein